MTEAQKEIVRAMRMQGIGYRSIAKELNLKENKVHLFCKTHGLAGEAWLVSMNYPVWCREKGICPVCGKQLVQPKRGRRKIFCSGKCRTAFCRSRQKDAGLEETKWQ